MIFDVEAGVQVLDGDEFAALAALQDFLNACRQGALQEICLDLLDVVRAAENEVRAGQVIGLILLDELPVAVEERYRYSFSVKRTVMVPLWPGTGTVLMMSG